MQKKPPILIIAAVLGVLAIGGTALMLMGRNASVPVAAVGDGAPATEAAVAPTPVPEMRYIANRDIPPRTTLTSDMLRRTAISGPMPPGAITSLDDVRGKITSKMIRSGDTVTDDSFIEPLDRAIPARFSVPSGFRAVAIYVNPQQTAAGLVDVGDRVDVLVTQKLSIEKGPNQFIVGAKDYTAGRTIGTNLLVLAVEESLASPISAPTPVPAPANGAAPAGAPADGTAPLPADAAPPPPPPAPPEVREGNGPPQPTGNIRVILAAPLETASRLVAANDSVGGVLHVVVRNPLDGDNERAPEVKEYPSRTITLAPPASNAPASLGNGGSGGSRTPAFPVPDLPDVTVSQTNPAPAPPMPVTVNAPQPRGGMNMTIPSAPDAPSTPAEPPMRDVMVVRGTEKTRVLVPKR